MDKTSAPAAARDADPARDAASADLERSVISLYQVAKSRVKDMAHRFDPELTPLGFGIMRQVFDSEPVRAGDIAQALGLDKSVVSRQIAIMREMKLLATQSDPEDGRATLLVSSEAAREALEAFRLDSRESYAQTLSSWTTDDIRTLATLLGRFVNQVD